MIYVGRVACCFRSTSVHTIAPRPIRSTDNPINSGIFHVYAPPTLCCTFNVASTNIYRAIQRAFPLLLCFSPFLSRSFSFLFFLPFPLPPPPPLPLFSSSIFDWLQIIDDCRRDIGEEKLRSRKSRGDERRHIVFYLLLFIFYFLFFDHFEVPLSQSDINRIEHRPDISLLTVSFVLSDDSNQLEKKNRGMIQFPSARNLSTIRAKRRAM